MRISERREGEPDLVQPNHLVKPGSESSSAPPGRRLPRLRTDIGACLRSWEFYLILLVAAFLRLYQIQTTEFDGDQADFFRLTYDAIHHGLIAATANTASLGILNPPATVYLLAIPALFSSSPVWAAVTTALLAIFGVALTYLFTRRYFGRLAGTFATLLYATSPLSVLYSRFIWNPNLAPTFVLLFLFTLFWGVVEQRKGWLTFAIFLIGLLFQLHGSAVLLGAPLVVALLLAPRTVRWRDLIIGGLLLILSYATYIIWEIQTKFRDFYLLLHPSGQAARIDTEALLSYIAFLTPFGSPYNNQHSYVYSLVPYLDWIRVAMPWLALFAGIMAVGLILWARRSPHPAEEKEQEENEKAQKLAPRGFWRTLRNWWSELAAHPTRSGLVILLVWQITPLLYLIRHSITVHVHYFILFMPGPFILIGLLLAKGVQWTPGFLKQPIWNKTVQSGICLLLILLTLGQGLTSGANIMNEMDGKILDTDFSPRHNDVESLQNALARADAVAQQHNIKRLLVSVDTSTDHGMRFLSEHTQTPATAFADNCWLLPNPSSGPAVMLLEPYTSLTPLVETGFAKATLVEESPRRGGPPFKIYLVESTALTTQATATQGGFTGNLQYLTSQRYTPSGAGSSDPALITRWNIQRETTPTFETTYNYDLTNLASKDDNAERTKACTLTSLQSGDQLFAAFSTLNTDTNASTWQISAQYYKKTPLILSPRWLQPLGISFLTGVIETRDQAALKTNDGKTSVTVPLPNRKD
jgi:4-amino-4-deoxy-L-arabinose transferase-like glycosyltransferase